MAFVPIGGIRVEVRRDHQVSELDYVLLRPLLRDHFRTESVTHLQRRQRVMQRNVPDEDLLLMHFLALGYVSLNEGRELIINLPPHFHERKNEKFLSHLLSRYVEYLERDGVTIRSINGVPISSSRAGSLEEKLAGIFGDRWEVVEKVTRAVHDEIFGLQQITTKSMAGMHGGMVGKYRSVEEVDVVFKVETDFLAAYKSTRVPFLIHQYARQDPLAARLAYRIPKPLTAFPLQQGAYWISLAEDFSRKVIPATKEDLMVMGPELQRGLNYTIVEALYVAALYQEVLGDILNKESDVLLAAESSIPSNLSEEEIRVRIQHNGTIYEQIKPLVEPLLAKVEERNAYLFDLAAPGQEMVHGDFKGVHRRNGVVLDTGSSRRDTVVVDLGRVFMDQPTVFLSPASFVSYVDCFVRMRQGLNPNYNPLPVLATTTALQTMNDALRNLGWELQQGELHNVNRYNVVLQRLTELVRI